MKLNNPSGPINFSAFLIICIESVIVVFPIKFVQLVSVSYLLSVPNNTHLNGDVENILYKKNFGILLLFPP